MQTQHLTAGFIGLGLIGGSIARALKKQAPSTTVMAYMRSRDRLLKAQEDGAVDIILEGVGEPLRQCDIIFLCTPVEYNASYLEQIRPYLKPGAVITDVGSTKTQIHEAVQSLAMEESFIGGHPMAGSEKTGYENSTDHLLENAYYILTPTDKTPESSVATVKSSVRGEEVALDVLAAAQPKKLYILLGTNTLTTVGAADRFLAYYGQMLDVLRQTLGEDCVIYVESIPPVRPKAAAEKPGLASDIIRSVNEQLALLAADKGCVYLDLWETLADGEGNLKEVLAAPDGVHFSAGNGYGAWVTYLRNHAKYSADNAWTPGSAYAG